MKRVHISALLVLVSMLAVATLAWSESTHAPRKFTVGIGAPISGGRVHLGATAPGGTLTVARATIVLQADGSQLVTLVYTNAASASVSQRTLIIDPGCTRVVDSFGNIVSASGPTAECTAATSFLGQVDSTISTAAAGGKLNL